jgi:hypothetical protein
MAEPESHTLHLLREIRGDLQGLDRKVDRNHAELKDLIDGLAQTLAGEMAARTYSSGGVERRLADIEKRLTVLEESE